MRTSEQAVFGADGGAGDGGLTLSGGGVIGPHLAEGTALSSDDR
ncbi:MAG: hypothetical protein JWS10_2345 [Cypionkella sp.]|nr:hypothetical protein [Cypionkella sp.]